VSTLVTDDTPALGPDEPAGDGRKLRRERNRMAVVDALLDLYDQGNLRPSSTEVAEQAGLSPRSLFRYFDDTDDLCRTAVDRALERARPLLPIGAGPDDPLPDRVAALVEQRLRLFPAVAAAATVSRLESPFQPALAARLRSNRAHLRDQLRALFAPELRAMAPARADAVLAAADVLTSFEAHQLLRDDQHLSSPGAAAAVEGALLALFGQTTQG